MVATGPGRTGARWRRVQAQVMADGEAQLTPCCLCGRAIDYQSTKVRPLHRMAGTVHHVIGLAQGGDPTDLGNLAPAHRGCNTRQGNRVKALLQQRCVPLEQAYLAASRRW